MTRKRVFLGLSVCATLSFLLWESFVLKDAYLLHLISTLTANVMKTGRSLGVNHSMLETMQHTDQQTDRLWAYNSWFGKNQKQVNANSTAAGNRSIFHSFSTIPVLSGDSQTNLSAGGHNSSKVLCVNFDGRLGNQLFEYASTLGLALKTKRIPVFLGDSLLRKMIQNTSLIDGSFQYTNRCKEEYRKEAACCKYFEGFLQLDPQKDYTIGTCLQSFRYFDGYEAQIRQALKFNDVMASETRQTVASLRLKFNRTLTGIHVRRGDFLHLQHAGYKTAPFEYLVHAMNYVKKRFGDVAFVVCSDDVKWCQERFGNASDVVVMSGPDRSPLFDMMLLASLDHMIMTTGTYSWWASFLNPGITVYYRDFVFPNSWLARLYNPNGTDYYYPNWIPLS